MDGIYVDLISKEPLFCSHDKVYNARGVATFSKGFTDENFHMEMYEAYGFKSIILKSKDQKNNLGVITEDPSNKKEDLFEVNSHALQFVKAESLKQEGYPLFEKLFKVKKWSLDMVN